MTSGCLALQRQGEKVLQFEEEQGSWAVFTELKLPVPARPQNGSIILYNRKKVKYRKDGYLWKKRKDGKTTREDHMKLKVQGVEVRVPAGRVCPRHRAAACCYGDVVCPLVTLEPPTGC